MQKKNLLSIKKNLLINLLTQRFFKKAFTIFAKIFQYYAEDCMFQISKAFYCPSFSVRFKDGD